MDNQEKDGTPDKLFFQAMVNQIVDDARVVWGKLTDDKVQLLSGVVRNRYGISHEEAQDHIAASMNRFQGG